MDRFGLVIWHKESALNLEWTDADAKGPNSGRRVTFLGYFFGLAVVCVKSAKGDVRAGKKVRLIHKRPVRRGCGAGAPQGHSSGGDAESESGSGRTNKPSDSLLGGLQELELLALSRSISMFR